MLPLVHTMCNTPGIEPVVVATGQHPGIVKEILSQYDLPVHADLEVGRPGITLNEIFSEIVLRFDRFFRETYGVEIGRASCREGGERRRGVAGRRTRTGEMS